MSKSTELEDARRALAVAKVRVADCKLQLQQLELDEQRAQYALNRLRREAGEIK